MVYVHVDEWSFPRTSFAAARDVVCTPGGEHMRAPLSAGSAAGYGSAAMEIEHARLLAERLHADDYEEDGTALLEHIRRVVCRVDADVQVVAWLHEVLEWTVVAEPELLGEGLDSDELRALRLLYRADDARSGGVYLAHVGLIARAAGRSGRLARLVKIADLQDRCMHPRVRADGWSPPYPRGLALLTDHDTGRATALRPFGRPRIANSGARRL
jgi:hypothetical protein